MELLNRLIEGNGRFVREETTTAHEGANWRQHLVGGQQPFATILGCSDSRVPPELVFDQGFGDLFVVRLAGNVIDPDVIGSIQYAVGHLGTTLLVVLGHESCGAVTAALDLAESSAQGSAAQESPALQHLLAHIVPSISSVDRALPREARIAAAVEANVRHSCRQLHALVGRHCAEKAPHVTIVGAVYQLCTGEVRFLEHHSAARPTPAAE